MFANAMEVFKLLDQSNCRKCNETTCLAFASKVFLGQKTLDLCPAVDPEILKRYGGQVNKNNSSDAEMEKALAELKEELGRCDLEEAARRTGGKFQNNRLTLKIFGRLFSLENGGRIITDIHTTPWLVLPVISYVLDCKGVPLTGKWTSFREIENAREKYGLFAQRAEKPLQKIADTHTALFEDLTLIFNGREVENVYESDIALVLEPLPMVPMLICYWKPEEGMESDLRIFYDSSASANAGADIAFGLGTGFVRMLERLTLTHGWQEASAHG
ncbi:DUF3786 domain-containing protein [Desulfospira joergensenii]|uniref:DUF3786 domain-containing protein n=1 Tax=Desulfospira joergensenii TaxID=53329 RepID=UPI0003B30596|nr:DUF3786 domain-containing protein [Desulfospira joergensenii]